ncbi:hypothetical protein HNR34_002066 [Geobacillus subterraneus]
MLSPSKYYVIFSKSITIANFFARPAASATDEKPTRLTLFQKNILTFFVESVKIMSTTITPSPLQWDRGCDE